MKKIFATIVALHGIASASENAMAQSFSAHACHISEVKKTAEGVDVSFVGLTFIDGTRGSFRIDGNPLAFKPGGKELSAYPVKEGDTLFESATFEDACSMIVAEDAVVVRDRFDRPGLPGGGDLTQISQETIPALKSVDQFPERGYMCSVKGAVKTPTGMDIYFTGIRFVSGPLGFIEINSDPEPLRPAYSARLSDVFHFGKYGVGDCTMRVTTQDGLVGIRAHYVLKSIFDKKIFSEKDEFIPAK